MLVGAAAAAAACGPGGGSPTATVEAFHDAVQERDLNRLYCLAAGAPEALELGATDVERRAGFAEWASAHYEAYESGRDEGWVELDSQGLVLVKLFVLGRGTFETREVTRRTGDGVVVESRIRFGYPQLDLSPLPPGTTFYVCGAPVGRVHALQVPAGPGEVSAEVLESVTVAWTLVRAEPAGGCPRRWVVASAEPVEGSLITEDVRWSFR